MDLGGPLARRPFVDGPLVDPVVAAREYLGAVVAEGTVMEANTECIYGGWEIRPEFGGRWRAFDGIVGVEHPGPAGGAEGAGGCEGLRAILGEVDPWLVVDLPRNAGGSHGGCDDFFRRVR